MSADDLDRIRELVTEQLALLASVGHGATDPDTADAEYRRNHEELRRRLTARGRPCLCPWASIKAWPYAYYRDEGLDEALDELVRPLGGLLVHMPTPPPWTLVYYRRDGDAADLPFGEFERSLSEEEFVVLDESLNRELAVYGPKVLGWKKGHTWPCGGGERPRPKVMMYKIEEGAPSRRVVLRVFFDTARGNRLVLLHGYNKGEDDSANREAAEAEVACARRKDLAARLAADQQEAPAAVATAR